MAHAVRGGMDQLWVLGQAFPAYDGIAEPRACSSPCCAFRCWLLLSPLQLARSARIDFHVCSDQYLCALRFCSQHLTNTDVELQQAPLPPHLNILGGVLTPRHHLLGALT